MSKLKQFFFKPQGKDRKCWALIDALFTLFFTVMIVVTYHKFGRWAWPCTMDSCFAIFNFTLFLLQYALHVEWKKTQTSI